MLGGNGLAESSKAALLNANYMAHRLKDHYSLRFTNHNGRVAHELLLDLAEFDKVAGLKVNDFAKRLQVRHNSLPFGRLTHLILHFRTMASIPQHVHGPSQRACSSSLLSRNLWKRLIGEFAAAPVL